MENRPANAVFEGGGVKGIGLIGAAAVAEEKGYYWANTAGSSGGAIVAALLAAGYSAAEVKHIFLNLDYSRFKDVGPVGKIPLVGPLINMVFNLGIYKGNELEHWLGELLAEKGVITFKDLLRKNETDKFRLQVIASDISKGRILILPKDIAEFGINPMDLKVSYAVRMSISVPFFYAPIKIKSKETGQKSCIVDGGLLSNFPVWLFDTETEGLEGPTFGFKMVEPGSPTPRHIVGLISLYSAIVSTLLEARDEMYIPGKYFSRTIPIPTQGIKSTDFNITAASSEWLYQSGRNAAMKFFDGWDSSLVYGKFVPSSKLIEDYEHRHGEKLNWSKP